MPPLPPPPQNPAALPAWRKLADSFERTRRLITALNGQQGRARLIEVAMQHVEAGKPAGAINYLRNLNNGNFQKVFRVLFPDLPSRPSQKAIAARLEQFVTDHSTTPTTIA